MAQQSSATTTKSIDVGGVFLMDLSVNEAFEPSELLSSGELLANSTAAGPFELVAHDQKTNNNNTHNHRAQPSVGGQHHLQQIYDTTNNSSKPTSHNPLYRASQPQANHYHQDKSIRLSPTAYQQYGGNRRAPQAVAAGPLECDLASVINCDRQRHGAHTTTVRPYEVDDEEGDLSSLSDESYLPTSSGTSLSVSLTGSASETDGYGEAEVAEQVDNEPDRDKESTTTREDSGVLDMKDLGGSGSEEAADKQQQQQHQVPRSLERDHHHQQQQQHHEELLPGQEKSISANIMATNLINTTANGNTNFHYQATNNNINYNKQQQPMQPPLMHQSISKPTDGSNNHQTHTHHITHNHNQQQQQQQQQLTVTSSQVTTTTTTQRSNARGISSAQRPAVSASLPIQVPARQMKKNLNRMKLKLRLMKDSDEETPDEQVVAAAQQQPRQQVEADNGSLSPPMIVRCGDRNRPALENIAAFCGQVAAADDDAAFLNQEFNANHHNHYPIDELDSEHLTAEEDPMRLFASIQALAKSLHEDAELFGSLPPKRMLESPIRSLALA